MHMQDPEGFVEDGGWSFLDQEGGSDAEGEEDESEGDGARGLVSVNVSVSVLRPMVLKPRLVSASTSGRPATQPKNRPAVPILPCRFLAVL